VWPHCPVIGAAYPVSPSDPGRSGPARTLFIAESTVKFHVANIMRKLGVGRRSEAVCVASQMGAI